MSFFTFQTVIILIVITFIIGIIVGIVVFDQVFMNEFPDLYSEFKDGVEQTINQEKEKKTEDMWE